MQEKLAEIPREKKIEFEINWIKFIYEFLWWVWDKEKWVSLTGSATKLTIELPNWKKIVWLVDFWMFQGGENDLKYNEILPFDLKEIDFVLLTHTHVDHIWKLLHFAKDEFNWTIWTTKINKRVLHIMLSDIIKLQPENKLTKKEKIKNKIENLKNILFDLENKYWKWDASIDIENIIEDLEEELKNLENNSDDNKKEYFDETDLLNVLEKVNWVEKYTKNEIQDNIELSFIKAGHLPWSSQIILKIKWEDWKLVKIGFSWDLWKITNPAVWGAPDISKEKLDVYMIESTYAGRKHIEKEKNEQEFIDAINKTVKNNWKIIIPVFMQWRAQELLLYIQSLIDSWEIPKLPIFFHSSNIEKINEIYSRYYEEIFWDLTKWIFKKATNWKWKNKHLNFEKTKGSAILLASWWMLDWGAIQNYYNYLLEKNNLFVSAWYQASWTLGNKIFVENSKQIDIPWLWKININCDLFNLRTFSWHADENDLLKFLSQMNFSNDAKIIINHWEKTTEQLFFWELVEEVVWKTRKIILADFYAEKYSKEN